MAHVVIEPSVGAPMIHKDIYGHFSEHLGRCIYDGFWVGLDATLPNTRGIRNDIIEALRRIRVPMLRWPGGCFADTYHWKDGVGPPESRKRVVNTHWGGDIDSNHFGTHEFLDLCEQLGCAAYVAGNMGSGTVREMTEWMEYMTGDARSPMGAWRAVNGRTDPWEVSYIGVGNENWGCGGNMRPEYYADLYRQYASYVQGTKSRPVTRVACGPDSFNYRWTEAVMKSAAPKLDMLSLHYYTVPGPAWEEKGSATEFGLAEWFQALRKGSRMEELIVNHLAIMDRYDPEHRVALAVDEWGVWHNVEPGTNERHLYQQNTIRDAVLAALTLNIFNHHAGRLTMAALAQTVNVLQALILTRGEQLILTPTYHVFDLYKEHQNATLLSVSLACKKYAMDDEQIEELSVSASEGTDGRLVTIANLRHDAVVSATVEFPGVNPTECHGRILSAGVVNAHNTFGNPETVKPTEMTGLVLRGKRVDVTLPAMSVAAIHVK